MADLRILAVSDICGLLRLPDGLSVRAVCDLDEHFLERLFTEQKAADFAGAGFPDELVKMLVGQQFRAQQTGYRISWPDAVYLIICRDCHDIGRLTLSTTGKDWHIIDIALGAAKRDQGTGTAVISALCDAARASGVGRVLLSVFVGNVGARRLYERLGFEVVDADDPLAPYLAMEKALA